MFYVHISPWIKIYMTTTSYETEENLILECEGDPDNKSLNV